MAEKELAQKCKEQEILPLASLLLPAISSARRAQARGERRLVELQAIEALRHYAARHDHQFPESLDQVTDHPIPLNPLTGKPLVYRRDGKTAVLEAIELANASPRRYRMMIAESSNAAEND